MWRTELSSTANTTLEKTFSQLKLNPDVDAILLMGSAATQAMSEHSDYDLACIVHNLPQNVLGINTYVDNRFTEIFFYSPEEINELLSKDEVHVDEKEGWLIHWSRGGRIIVDKSGLLKQVKKKSSTIKEDIADTLIYSSWHKINYNFVQNMRYFNSRKEEYLQALDIRLLYSIVEVFVGYFNVRKIPWRGEKQAIQWLKENDADFLRLFQNHLAETDRSKKVGHYEKLVNRALKQIGGVWEDKVTSIVPIGDFNEETIKTGRSFWNRLLKNSE